jgi:large subunit ribosomal protein L23
MNIIRKPIVTEKMTTVGEKLNQVGFVVDPKANKLQIKKAVEELYGVKVDDVHTMICRGKTKNRMTKAGYITGKTSSYKKAIITLAEGEKIDFYSNI